MTRFNSYGLLARNGAFVEATNCVIYRNDWTGVTCQDGSVLNLVNCTLTANSYGAYVDDGTISLKNCLATGNTQGGIFAEGASSVTVACCDVHNPGSTYGNYRNTANRTGQNGNISADPLYLDAAANDYRLRDGSPAIDAGTSEGAPVQDILGLIRYDHPGIPNAEPGLRGYYDMGAFEYGGLTPLDIDLVTSNVTGPTTGTQNGTVHITWDVSNTGTDDATRPWYDVVYLSADAVLSADDRLIGSMQHTTGLTAGSSYSAELDILLQGVIPGSFHFIVLTDARYETLEGGSRSNNATPSAATATFAMPQLTLGIPAVGGFAVVGDVQYYQVLIPTGSNLLVRLDDEDNAGLNELCVSRGTPPTVGAAQYLSTGSADHTISVPAAPAGAWYVLVHNAAGTGNFSLLAEVTHLGLYSVIPESLGSAADMALTLVGAGFAPGVQVHLVGPGGSTYAGSVDIDSYSQITATFAAGSVPAGVYSVRVSDAGTSEVSELADAFTVLAGGAASLEVDLILPGVLGYHQLATIYVEYRNTGDLAMPAPLLTVTASQAGREAALMTLDRSLVSVGFWTDAVPEGFSHAVQFLASGGSPGILQPGESGRIPVYYAGWLKPWDFSYPPVTWRVGVTEVGNPSPVDWPSLKEGMRPEPIPADAWEAVWANFTAAVGTTWGDYVATLDRDSVSLARLGYAVSDIQQLLGLELMHADGMLSRASVARVVDGVWPAPGLALAITRTFPNSISGRYRMGPFGRGWVLPWHVSLTERGDGTVVVDLPDGAQRVFQPDIRGGYSPRPGDYATLSAVGGGVYRVTEKDGTASVFGADGRLAYVEHSNGNRITCGYTGGRLTSLAHSSGQALTITYTPGGLIQQITSPTGRRSTYGYDAAGEHLLSVTAEDGRTLHYRYVSGSGAAREHALEELTDTTGVRRVMAYDANGRLSLRQINDGEERLLLSYPAPGTVVVTNALGQTATHRLDHRAYLARVTNAYGYSLSATFDDLGHLTDAVDSAGRALHFDYDARGDMVRQLDPLGQETAFAYTPRLSQLQALTDSLGRVALYSYDPEGNLLEATLDGGMPEYFAYASSGTLAAWTNRRGHVTTYSHNAESRLTARNYPVSPDLTFAYGAHGNVTSATDGQGTTTLTWNAANELTRITDPGGRFLEYTYDAAGRIESRTDPSGGTVTYHYDAAGRLGQLTDGGGANIITYGYDAAGRLTTENRGNGVTTSYAYDDAGRTTGVVHRQPGGSVLAEYAFVYDNQDRLTAESTPDGTWHYQYDALDRLVSAVLDSSNAGIPDRAITYEYDGIGNRTHVTTDGNSEAYTTNALNQYTLVGDTAYTYDPDGNLHTATQSGVTTTYSYDEANRLTRVESPGSTWTCSYDAFGNRTVVTANGVTTYYVYDPFSAALVGAYDAAGVLLARYDHGIGLVRQTQGGVPYYHTYDGLGSTDQLTDNSGTPVNQYAYGPFGEVLRRAEGVANPFTYVGSQGVVEEANGLYRMGARHYHAGMGRFTSQDPLRMPPWGLYTYCGNDPVNRVDPSGFRGQVRRYSDRNEWIRSWRRQNTGWDEYWYYTEELNDQTRGTPYLDGIQQGRDEIAENSDRVATQGLVDWASNLGSGPPTSVRDGIKTIYDTGHTLYELHDAGFGPLPQDASGADTDVTSGSAYGPGGVRTPYPGRPSGTYNGGGPHSTAAAPWPSVPAPEPPATVTATGASGSTQERDPNAKTGPAGVGPGNCVRPEARLAYRIEFENDPEATAPAQIVRLRDPLTDRLAWDTFELTEVGFGDTILPVPAGTMGLKTVASVSQSGVTLNVHIEVGINLATGLLEALFYTIDPSTGLPPPVEFGFLPPEDGSGRGQGHIGYLVSAAPGLASGTELRNVATIVFGVGEGIATNQVDPHDPTQGTDPTKEALVTIDADVPASQVEALPALSVPGFAVSWSGSDGGAGIATYTIYVQDNGGPFVAWLTDTTLTTAVYPGVPGHAYGFYSIATDGVGYEEEAKTAAETSTTVAYTVVFEPSGNGSLEGTLTQYVAPDGVTTPVQAEAAEGYHLRRWTVNGVEYSTDTSLVIAGVHEDMTVVGEFEINRYTVTFLPGEHGSLPGGVPEVATTVDHGDPAPAPPTITPAEGWRFTGWAPPLPVTVTANLETTAQYSRITYTVTFLPGAHGSLPGGVPEVATTVDHGDPAPAPPAITPAEGWRFTGWVPVLPDTVTADLQTTAQYSRITYTVTFLPGEHGSLPGGVPEVATTVDHGDPAPAPPTITPAEGWRFTGWAPVLPDTVTADLQTTAQYSRITYTVTFLPGEHGSLPGGVPAITATVNHGDPAPAPPAVTPAEGWRFTGWAPALPDTVTADLQTTAQYQAAGPTVPEGEFRVGIDATAVAAGAGIWPLSGPYDMALADSRLTMDLVHDSLGRIGGEGAFTPDPVGAETYVIPLAVRGTCRGSAGALVVRLTLTGQRSGTPDDPQARAKVAITMVLSPDAPGKLTGNARVNLALGAARQAVTVGCSTDLPPDVDGTYALLLDLTRDGKRIEGGAWLTLSNHAVYELLVRGRYNGEGSSLRLSGAPGDPAAKGLRLVLDVITLEDRSTTVRGLSGTAFGQSLRWSP